MSNANDNGWPVRTFRRLGFPLALAGLVGVAAVSYGHARQFRNDVEWRGRTHRALEHIERGQTALLAADSFRRAYRLSRDRDDVREMDAHIATSTQELATVGELLEDSATQEEHLRALRPIIAERVAILHDGLDLPSWDQLDANTRTEQRARQSHGSDLTKRITAEIDAIRDEELGLLDDREHATALSAAVMQRTLLYGNAAGMGLVALIYASLVLENRRRLRVQRELLQANTLFQAVLDGTTDVIAVKDTGGHYLLINPAGCRNLGRTRDEILGLTDGELLTGGTGPSVMAADADVLRGGETQTFEQVASVGERTWTFLSTRGPYRSPTGEVLGIIAVSRDITERKQLEERVAQQNVERGEIIQRLQHRTDELAALGDMARLIQSTYAFKDLYTLVGDFAMKIFAVGGVFALVDPSRARVEPMAHWGARKARPPFELSDCWAIRTGRWHVSGTGASSCRHASSDSGPTLCVPLVTQGETLGVLQFDGEPTAGERQQLLGAFTEQLALAIANLQLRETLRSQAIRDPLTDLYNRRYMDETLARELSRVKRRGGPLSVVMIDIDHFKRFNDTAGHAAGDEILKCVARQLMRGIRREDVACRYGGEEFALILPDLALDGAIDRAEKLRQEIGALSVEIGGVRVGPVTASFGVACHPIHGSSGERLVRAADTALYRAKSRGRNCVVTADVPDLDAAVLERLESDDGPPTPRAILIGPETGAAASQQTRPALRAGPRS